jgi:hypothetical protein
VGVGVGVRLGVVVGVGDSVDVGALDMGAAPGCSAVQPMRVTAAVQTAAIRRHSRIRVTTRTR